MVTCDKSFHVFDPFNICHHNYILKSQLLVKVKLFK